jgi:hypothetical protein
MNRSPKRWTLLLVVLASLIASMVVFAGPAAADRCNDTDRIDLNLTHQSSSASRHTFTVANAGPDCAHDVVLNIWAKPAPAVVSRVVSASPNSWKCSTVDSTQPGASQARCTLSAAIPAPPSGSTSASVTVQLSQAATALNAEVGSEKLREEHSSDNEVWGSFGTRASSADFPTSANQVNNQNTEVNRPANSSISINQLRDESKLAEPSPPCAAPVNVCLTSGQVSVATPSLTGVSLPEFLAGQRITTVITVDTLQDPRARVPVVYRFIDFDNGDDEWRALPSCSAGAAISTDIGCVASISTSTDQNTLGHLKIEIWTTHNGHYR